ncbi:MAG: 2,3,4,5-tetrahydropyridine-2,6-dicarboxylate N-succinyltransferase [Planctomycetaceae bacterium]|nr:2,3,4,5-tetrahydropyridine-2,6-dicarboxylate N-succinyltransferase [Planctomycetaceae bacterium]
MSERLTGTALLEALEQGRVRVAERGADGAWTVHAWVKEEILAVFRASPLVESSAGSLTFVDKRDIGPRSFSLADKVRVVPGGSSVRRGAYLAPGVIVMPPAYVNVGAFVDEGSMVDSHALVGSCAQIGKRVHLSAACQIGGVLEPAGARPVIIEDDAFVGGNTGVYEGVLVRRGAVLASGVILSASTVVYDVPNRRELRGSREAPLEIPENAVVVPGTRAIARDGVADSWAMLHHVQIACAVIVKYRDARTDRATALEEALR